MAGVLQAIALISEPPGAYLYQVILLCVLAFIAGRSAAVGAKPLALAFCGLAGLRLLALVVGLLTSALPIYQLIIIPPFDRAVACLTIFGLIWAFTYPHSSPLAYGLAAAALLMTSAAAVASWVVWLDAVGTGSLFYNGSLQDTLWLTAQLFILAAGMFVLARQGSRGWQVGLALLVILFVSEGLHYLFPIADANVPGFVRLAELIVWPVAAAGLWRRPQTAPEVETAANAAVPNPLPAIQNMSVELLQAELESANRRNQQLRETNRQTRQQLAAATASLAKVTPAGELNPAAVSAGESSGPAEAALARAELGQALQQEEAAARQSAETRLASTLNGEQSTTAQAAQQVQAEAALRAELRDSRSALAEARRTSDRAQAQLAEQASQLGALQRQVAQLEQLAKDRTGQVERRHPAPNEDKRASHVARPPRNGNTSREESAAAAGGNGNGPSGHAANPSRAGMLGSDLTPELTPIIAGPICLHLGLQADHATRHAFPSDANRCLGLTAPAEVSFEQQRRFCLSSAHVGCPIFTRQLLNPMLPINTSPDTPDPKSAKGLGGRVGRLFRRQS